MRAQNIQARTARRSRGRPGRWRVLAAGLLVLFGIFGLAASAQDSGRVAVVLTLDGAVGPASADYLKRGIGQAGERGAAIIVLKMDTPGGLDTSMREIIHAILASPVPVASFVTPSGARAASAGTYILYASHVAAMTPGTNLGAATPIAIGGGGGPFGGGQDRDDGKDPKDKPAEPANAAGAKAINDAVAYIRGLAEMRGRNVDWAEQAVREAASLTATDAEREKVIDFTATSVEDLLAKADGMTVRIAHADVVLATGGLSVETIEPDWRTRFLSVITNPNIALIFMMVGIYGLVFEFMNPGALVPGTVGAISLVLGLYSLAVLPVSYAGIGLIVLGVALLVTEILTPSFGVLGVGGAAALVLGSAILFDTGGMPGLAVSWPLLAALGVASLLFSLLTARLAVTSRHGKVVSGAEQMLGSTGEVLNWEGHSGHVFVHSERWRAVSSTPLSVGQTVRVEAIDGLTLEVTAVRQAGMS
ncbi:MAG: nodulation protein NfeD [Burkholderiaceae bacterium]